MIIRVSELKEGDIFIMFGHKYRVLRIDDKIWYFSFGSLRRNWKMGLSLGLKSKQRVELVENIFAV